MITQNFKDLQYLLAFPEGYVEGEKYPVIIFLHGAGTRGNDIEMLKKNPYFKNISIHKDFPFVIVAPQCNKNTWFDHFEALKELALFISTSAFADTERIYLMGASMGGYATWQLAMSLPKTFAGIVPICGGGMYWNAHRLLNTPVWAFHGEKDRTVLCEESRKMVDVVNKKGGNAKLTVYPEAEHDSWTETYRNPEVFEWLLSQKNGTVRVLAKDGYSGSEAFG